MCMMLKGFLQFVLIMTAALCLSLVVGHAGGYAIMYIDEYEIDRTIK